MRKYSYLFGIICVIALLAFHSCGRRGTNQPEARENRYPGRSERASSQISFLNVNSFCQDSLGYMWIGTLGGINRYNGYEYLHYTHDETDSTSLRDDFVFSLFYDKSCRLWVGTAGGADRYDFETDRFEHIGDIASPIYSFHEDTSGRIWAATPLGPSWIDPAGRNLVSPWTARNVNLYWEDLSGRLWMGLSEKEGLAVLKNDTAWESYTLPGERWVLSMYSAPNGMWWLGTNNGIVLFDPDKREFKDSPSACMNDKLSGTNVVFIKETEPLKLLIGTSTQGLFQYDLISQELSHNEPRQFNPLRSAQLMTCYTDRQENVWVGSYDKGFTVASKSLGFFNSDHRLSDLFNDKFVTRVLPDRFGNLWISTRYDGLYHYNTAQGKVTVYDEDNYGPFSGNNGFLESLFIDSQDRIWIGFVNRIITGTIAADGRIAAPRNVELRNVRVMKEDSSGQVWTGTLEGLFRIACRGQQAPEITNFSSYNIPDICLLRSGDILFSSYGDGIFKIARNDSVPRLLTIPGNTHGVDRKCVTLFEDSQNRLWMGSYGYGMIWLSADGEKVYQWNENLPSKNVLCYQEDVHGDIWMSTSNGISRLKISSSDTVLTNYFHCDGIVGEQFHEKAGCRLPDGRIFFAGNHGLTFFNPSVVLPVRKPPVIRFEDLKIFNRSVKPAPGGVLEKSITFTDRITLRHDQTTISIDYSGIDFIGAEKLTYKYRMEGLDQDWNYVGGFRRASYANLPPGKYTFSVSAMNDDGVESPCPATLQIEVKPAPWFSWQAWLLYAILLTSVVSFILNLWVKVKMNRKRLEMEHNEWLREREVSEMKENFFTNISHELRTPLTLISAPLQQLETDKSLNPSAVRLLGTISRNVQHMLRLINQLLDFSRIESGVLSLQVEPTDIVRQLKNLHDIFMCHAERKKIGLFFSPHTAALELWADTDKIDKILHNLLSNALKYTTEGMVEIITAELSAKEVAEQYPGAEAPEDSAYIEIAVSDTGPGIPEEKMNELFVRYRRIISASGTRPDYSGSGIGLHYTKCLVESHKGRIRARVRPEGGMEFSFVLPLHDIYSEDHKKDRVQTEASPEIPETVCESPGQNVRQFRYTILIAEDNEDLMEFIGGLLRDRYNLLAVPDGKKAWESVQNDPPDLILSDVVMPGMSGYELCANVKQNPEFCHIPVILLTAKTTMQDQVKGLEYGADAYICKPFHIDYLLLTINNLLLGRDRIRQYFSTPHVQQEHAVPEALNAHDKAFLEKLTFLLEQQLSNPDINIDYAARELGFSKTGLYRKIKGLTDMSPIDFMISYRMRRAAEKIMDNVFSLAEIADQTGFSSYSYFSKSFKKHFGVTPREYQKSGTAPRTEQTGNTT